MMHGHEKSDPEIAAIRTNAGGIRREKPANNAAPAATELVERRAGTKENTGQQSTLRAQDRAGVSQALERIRQAARHNKTVRFTALLHHVNPETLRLAFNALKKDAAPRYGRDDLVGLRGRPGAPARGTTRPGAQGSISAATVTPGVYTKRGRPAAPRLAIPSGVGGWNLWQASPTRGRRSRGQDCSRRGREGAERDLRGGFPRVLVWVPAGTWPARCAGHGVGRDRQPQGELGTRRRHSFVFRHGRPEMDDPFR